MCLDHLTADEPRALELASRPQAGLLPPRVRQLNGWDVAFGYDAAGVVSGDYCDLIDTSDGAVHVMLGDVSGKGVAAALLMSQLHALFRALVPGPLTIERVCAQVNDTFAASTPATHYATLVCVRATPTGTVTIVNAGHPPALVWRAGCVTEIESAGLPIGMFAHQHYTATDIALGPADLVVLYSDGIVEAEDDDGQEFGRERLGTLVGAHRTAPVATIVDQIEHEVARFTGRPGQSDDRTVAVLRRV